jgi:molecular chaperone DnaK (HSP70)
VGEPHVSAFESGSGTFDVTLLTIDGVIFEVKAMKPATRASRR